MTKNERPRCYRQTIGQLITRICALTKRAQASQNNLQRHSQMRIWLTYRPSNQTRSSSRATTKTKSPANLPCPCRILCRAAQLQRKFRTSRRMRKTKHIDPNNLRSFKARLPQRLKLSANLSGERSRQPRIRLLCKTYPFTRKLYWLAHRSEGQ